MLTLTLGAVLRHGMFSAALALLVLSGGAAQAGTLGVPQASPAQITAGVASVVTVSVVITDPNYLAGSANLLRLNADGSTHAVLGALRDDGLGGDAVAGDQVYTLRTTLTEAAAGEVRLQISAAYRRELRRTLSAPFVVRVAAGASSIGAVQISPATTQAGVAVVSLVTAVVDSPTVVPGSVVLQKLGLGGVVLATLGVLHDDGLDGDAAAGDKTFSLRTTVLENNPGSLNLRVAAMFQGQAQPAYSGPLAVAITGTATGIAIAAPANGAYLNTPVITLNGTVGDAGAQVSINGIATPVAGGAFSAAVPLNEGPNTLTAVALNGNGSTSTASVLVTLDTTAPRVEIYSPAAGGSTSAERVTVSGLINDIVVGTVNPQQATVTVNGVPAAVVNRSFVANDVALLLGVNSVQAVATDRAGNRATTTVSVTRVAAGAGGLALVSGNNQSGPARSALAGPLVVRLSDGAGNARANQPVVFRVIGQDGMVSPTGAAGTGLGAVAVNTDAQGRAQVFMTLGSRAGAGNNLVEASATGVATTADFAASATPGAPQLMVVDSGNNQTGVVGQPLPLAFIAIVTDANNNRLANVPVSFEVNNGGGGFAGPGGVLARTLQTVSDGDGRVAATLTLGSEQGVNNNLVEASFTGNTGFSAAFMATGLVPGPLADTRISGVVLDNSNIPIPGVTMRLLQINQGNASNIPQEMATAVRTDAQGQFVLQPVPVGIFKLMADGGTAQRSGSWPTLEYDLITVSGQNNTVGMPVYLPELNPNNRVCVNETTGGTLTLAEAPGFALTIAAGSATFPGGSRTGCVSVTPVNMDKVPMSPGFGQQPRFIVTIQPVGTHFNPPARMTIPNVDGLAPRAVTEMYSYDHDLASFVAIGSATVSQDGSSITSDPGAGVIKAGWHCGGNPAVAGSAGTCPTCHECVGSMCQAVAGTPACDDSNDCTTRDKCVGGVCRGEAVTITALTGACVAAIGAAETYTAASNDPSLIKWQAPGGTPASGTGATFGVRYAAAGNKIITAGCAANQRTKSVDVAEACASVPAALFDSTSVAGVPCATCFGEVNTPITHSAEFVPCVEGGKWCFREKKFTIEFKVGVQALGRTDVPTANAAAVTEASYCRIISDLTPNAASDCGRPPRTLYWSQSITLAHENFHVTDLRDNYLRPKMTELETFVKLAANCTDCKSDKTVVLNAKMEALYTEGFNAFVAGGLHECRAYGDGVAQYNALTTAIRARATAAVWAACPP